MTPEEKAKEQLGIIGQMKAHPDWETASPQARAFFEGEERRHLATLRNLARASIERDIGNLRSAGDTSAAERMEIAGENVRPLTNPEIEAVRADAPNRNRERAGVESNAARRNYAQAGDGYGGAALRQAGGTGAAVASLVPGLVSGVEAARELADLGGPIDESQVGASPVPAGAPAMAPPFMATGETVRAAAKALPREGETQRYIEESPSPGVSKATAMGLGLLGSRVPVLGPVNRALGTATGAVERPLSHVLPGRIIPRVAANATVGAGIGAADAGIRRVPQLVDPSREVEPLQLEELTAPAAGAAALSLPAATYQSLRGWATNPRTEVGTIARRYARNQREGVNEELERRYPRGNIGVSKLSDELSQGLEATRGRAKTEADLALERAAPPIKARTREQEASLDQAHQNEQAVNEMNRGMAAADIEPRVFQRMAEMRKSAADRLVASLDTAESEQRKFNFDGFLDDVRQIVAREARPDTAGAASAKPVQTGLVSSGGEPVLRSEAGAPGSAEVHTPYGRQLVAIENWAREYMPEGQPVTVRQVRNFIKYLRTVAESGTPEKAFPAKQILASARARLGEQDPIIGEALAEWNRATTRLQRIREGIARDPDTHKIGIMNPRDTFEAPEAGEPQVPAQASPTEQELVRKNLMALGDSNRSAAARQPIVAEMSRNGLGPEIAEMEERLGRIASDEAAQARQLGERKALLGEAEQRELAAARRSADEAAQGPVRAAERSAKDLMEAKEALELARFPGSRKLIRPSLRSMVGLTSHFPLHGIGMAGESGLGIIEATSIPVASRLALAPPTLGEATGLPGIETPANIGAARRPRRKEDEGRSEDVAQGLVDKARSVYGQAGRLRAPMADFLGLSRPR